jgi:putative isomerase
MSTLENHIAGIRSYLSEHWRDMLLEANGSLACPCLQPGSAQYQNVLWDWDSWLTNIALRQIVGELEDEGTLEEIAPYERGCVRNFLSYTSRRGWIPIVIGADRTVKEPEDLFSENMHKPCLAQHAAFLVRNAGGDAEWLREDEGLYRLLKFINNYRNHHRHDCGLYFWQTDGGVGVDNDPCSYDRPPRSCGSIYLNCMMAKELEAAAYLCERLNLDEVGAAYRADAVALKEAVNRYCWDERDGFYYSVDFNLVEPDRRGRHHFGQLRDWPCLVMRIGVWSGFMALWAGIADAERAARVVGEHYRNTKTFHAPFGVRSLSKMEPMYNLRPSGNPSSWLGPVWGIANYMTFRGLVRYGFEDDARDLAEKTVRLFGRDIERFGAMHEYYQPENGEPILNRGFLDWNPLVLNMIAWLEGKDSVVEF